MNKKQYETAVADANKLFNAGFISANKRDELIALAKEQLTDVPKNAPKKAVKPAPVAVTPKEEKPQETREQVKEETKEQVKEETKEKEPIPKNMVLNTNAGTSVEHCKSMIRTYNAKVKKAKIEELRKVLIAQSPNEKEEILAASDQEIEKQIKPTPRLDTLTKQKLRGLISFNFTKRIKKTLSKEEKTVIEDKFEAISKRIYELLESEIDKLLK
jgi:hypothetical protein